MLVAISKLFSLGNVLQKPSEIKPTGDIIIVNVCKTTISVKIVWRWGLVSLNRLLEYKPY